MAETSSRANLGGEFWGKNYGGGIVEEESCRRGHGGGIMEEKSWRRNHRGDVMEGKL